MSQSKHPLIRMCRMLKSRVSVLFVSCFVNLWILRADSHSIHAVLCNYTICFQLLQLLKVWGWLWRILKGVARTLWSSLLRNVKAKKKNTWNQQFGKRSSIREYADAAFSVWLPEAHFFSISNLTATVSVAAAVSRVILFLNCCRLTSIETVSQRRKRAHTFGQYLI